MNSYEKNVFLEEKEHKANHGGSAVSDGFMCDTASPAKQGILF